MSDILTGAELDEIQVRCNTCSPGEWKHEGEGSFISTGLPPSGCRIIGGNIGGVKYLCDCEFIEHARTDIPKLLKTIQSLQSELTECRERGASMMETIKTCVTRLSAFAPHTPRTDFESASGDVYAILTNILSSTDADRGGEMTKRKKMVKAYCPQCGPIQHLDEDGCCWTCGADSFSPVAPWFLHAIKQAVSDFAKAQKRKLTGGGR